MRRSFLLTAGLVAASVVSLLPIDKSPLVAPVHAAAAHAATTDGDMATPRPVAVLIARRLESHHIESRYAGQIIAKRSSALGFSRGGILNQVLVDDGDHVAVGQLLARLDTRALEAKANELRAELDRSQALLKVAIAKSEQTAALEQRRGSLARKDYVSKEAYDDAHFANKMALAERDAAQGAIRSAEATLATLMVDIELSQLKAPFAGSIVARGRDEGAVVAAGEPVLEIVETDVVEFRVGVPVAVAATLKEGDGHRCVIAGREARCQIARVLPLVDPTVRTVTVILAPPPDFPPTRSGELGHLLLDRIVDTGGFWLPLSALTESRRGLWAAFVVEPGADDPNAGTLSSRDLQVIEVSGDRAFVAGVLRDGERVVADGVHRLAAGMAVVIVNAPTKAAPPKAAPP